jgi:CelD/BcsL family acetyltransferase involved in cellulose biosynthesis
MPVLPSDQRHRFRLLDPAQLGSADLQCWDALAATDRDGNPFAQPWLLRLSLAHCDPAQSAWLAVVEAEDGQWLGAIPLARARAGRVPLSQWTGWSHPNQFTGTPLVGRDCAAAFWQGLLAGLDREHGGGLALALANLPLDTPVNQALFDLCEQQGRRSIIDRRWQRAALSPGPASSETSGKLRRRIDGLERKLEREHGPLSLEQAREPERIAELTQQFLALESAGWKGEAGSALASRGATQRFFCAVAQTGAAQAAFEISVLRSGERIVAMSTQLLAGATAHGFKAAYDEKFAAHAPGLLLLVRLTRHWQDHGQTFVDSCAKAGQEPVSRLWPARRELVDCRLALGGTRRRAGFAALLAAEAAWHTAKRLTGFADKA